MISILSPAKSMNFSQPVVTDLSDPNFVMESDEIMQKLKKISAGKLGKMMRINADIAHLNFDRNQRWNPQCENNEKNAAVFAFDGEVYRGLQAQSFSEVQLQFGQRHLRILSGLYGLLKPMDAIQPYRLEMGSSLTINRKARNLYDFWSKKVTDQLNSELKEDQNPTLINLASKEYAKVIDKKLLKAKMIEVQFLDLKNGQYKAVMTWAKKARGQMANQIITHGLDRSEDIKGIEFHGYYFNEALSSENGFTFTRDNVPQTAN
ncbi:MAG: peroxide stress protein YaaA [Vicingaceae bacterium]